MKSITRRGHLALAGLIGGLIGILVIALPTSPAAIPAPATLSAPNGVYNTRQVLPGDGDVGVGVVQAPPETVSNGGLNARQILPEDTDLMVTATRVPAGRERFQDLNARQVVPGD